MNLMQNSYLIDVAVHAEDSTPYDFHSRMYRIAFRSRKSDSGIFRPDSSWSFSESTNCVDLKELVETGDPDEEAF